MNVKVRIILEYMLDDALDIVRFTQEIGNAVDFAASRLYRKAIIMSILNIGEKAPSRI